ASAGPSGAWSPWRAASRRRSRPRAWLAVRRAPVSAALTGLSSSWRRAQPGRPARSPLVGLSPALAANDADRAGPDEHDGHRRPQRLLPPEARVGAEPGQIGGPAHDPRPRFD